MSQFIEYANIRHVTLTIDNQGLYISHNIMNMSVEDVAKQFDNHMVVGKPPLGIIDSSADPKEVMAKLKNREIPMFAKMLNIVANSMQGTSTVLALATLLSDKGGIYFTQVGSPRMPTLYILEVIQDLGLN